MLALLEWPSGLVLTYESGGHGSIPTQSIFSGWSLVWGVQESAYQWFYLIISISLSPSPFLSKINKKSIF